MERFHEAYSIERKNLPKDICGPGVRLTKVQSTTRPDHGWPEVWTKIGKAAQNREKQERAKEKPKLEHARRLRAIYFIDPHDQDYKETFKNARRKLERPMAAVMLCKKSSKWHRESVCTIKDCIREDSNKDVWLYGGISRIHKATSGIFSA